MSDFKVVDYTRDKDTKQPKFEIDALAQAALAKAEEMYKTLKEQGAFPQKPKMDIKKNVEVPGVGIVAEMKVPRKSALTGEIETNDCTVRVSRSSFEAKDGAKVEVARIAFSDEKGGKLSVNVTLDENGQAKVGSADYTRFVTPDKPPIKDLSESEALSKVVQVLGLKMKGEKSETRGEHTPAFATFLDLKKAVAEAKSNPDQSYTDKEGQEKMGKAYSVSFRGDYEGDDGVKHHRNQVTIFGPNEMVSLNLRDDGSFFNNIRYGVKDADGKYQFSNEATVADIKDPVLAEYVRMAGNLAKAPAHEQSAPEQEALEEGFVPVTDDIEEELPFV